MRRQTHNVLLADDHRLLRQEVREELEERGFRVVAEAGNALDAVHAALEDAPDLCLLDVQMPGDGIRAAAAIARRLPHVKIVVLTATREEDAALTALRAGASGYLLKDVDPDRLAESLRRVLEGDLAFPGRLVRRAVDELRLNPRGAADLAGEDWRVAELLGEGLSAAQVAERTALAIDTVRARIAAILSAVRDGAQRAADTG